MEDIHGIFTTFKEEFPEVNEKHEELGREVHERSGPLSSKTRWLIKIAVSAASGHHRALETHIEKARDEGASEEEIQHSLLLVIPTCGFPCFMEAYRTYKRER